MLKKIIPLAWLDWGQKKRSTVLAILVVLVTVLLILIFKFSQSQPPLKKQVEKTWIVQTQLLSGGEKIPQLKLYGRVESPFNVTLTASITADVQSLPVRQGQYVNKGELLLNLDTSDVQSVLEEKIASMAELDAQIELENNRYKNDLAALKLEKSLVLLVEKKLSREQKTSRSNLTSQSSLDTQKQALEQQRLAYKVRQLSVADHPARLAQLQAKRWRSQVLVQQAKKNLQRARIIAPYNAVILATRVAPGERVRPGESLLDIYAVDELEIHAQIPNKYIHTIRQALVDNQLLQAVRHSATGKERFALRWLSGQVADDGSGVDAIFTVAPGQAKTLLINETIALTLYLPALPDTFRVPVASIYGSRRIYLVKQGRLKAVTVTIVGNQFKDKKQYVLVQSKQLAANDQVITTQLPYALNGLKVKINNPPLPGRHSPAVQY